MEKFYWRLTAPTPSLFAPTPTPIVHVLTGIGCPNIWIATFLFFTYLT